MEHYMKDVSNLWKFLCVDFQSTQKNHRTTREKVLFYLKKCGFFYNQLNLIVYALLSFPLFADDSIDTHTLLYGCSVGIILLRTSLKYVSIYWNRADIGQLIEDLSKRYALDEQKKYGIGAKFKKIIKFTKFMQRYIFTAYLLGVIHRIVNLSFQERKEFFTIYLPFDPTRIEIFPIVFVWMWHPQMVALIGFLANESMFIVFVVIASMEFDVLRIDFEDIKNVEIEQKSEKLHELIERQVRLYEIVERIEKIYAPQLLLNFVLSSAVICLNAFQIITSANVVKLSVDIAFCFLTFLLIGLQCYFGEMLIESSEKISIEIYSSGWESISDAKLRKSLLIAMQRSQKPAKLTFMKFADVELNSFSTVSLFLLVNHVN